MGIIEKTKDIASIIRTLDNVELYRKIIDLQGEINELTRVNHEQAGEIERMRDAQKIIATLRFDSPFYASADGAELYCARCLEHDRVPIHVHETHQIRLGHRVWACPACKSEYDDRRTEKPADACPRCHQAAFHLVDSKPDPTFGALGVLSRIYRCSSCTFEESRQVDTHKA